MILRQLIEKLSVDIDSDEEHSTYNFTDDEGNKIGHVATSELYSLHYYFGTEDLEDEIYNYINDEIDDATKSEIQDALQTDNDKEMDTILKFIDLNDGKNMIEIQKVFVEKDYRGNRYGAKMLKMVLKSGEDYLLNASPEYDTSIAQIIRMYKSVGFKELFDQGSNMIMFKN